MSPPNKNLLTFQVKPRLLTLLGDQLIRDATLAVFELVKNAYDADATECKVTMEALSSTDAASIKVRDNGSGMDEAIIRNSWMVIGTDFRANQRLEGTRTPKFRRFPLGEKGLGRLSVHKLGRTIRLITRKRNSNEFVMDFNWDQLETSSTLALAPVSLAEREPSTFRGNTHGTQIEVTNLREVWTRGDLRRLHRAVGSLCSPFKGPDNFAISLHAPGYEKWLEGLLDAEDVKKCALYHVTGSFSGNSGCFDYSFMPPPSVDGRLKAETRKGIIFPLQKREGRKALPLDISPHSIGEVEFEFWLFDRDPKVIRLVTDDVRGLTTYLNENGGVRIYRDGIRVYDFGEPGNDWLNLDARRVNEPTAKTSNNQILGVLRLDATRSDALREKSNREGFIENTAYRDFIPAVISALTAIEAERAKEKRRIREVTGEGNKKNVFARLTDLRDTLEKKGVLKEVEPQLEEVEKEMSLYRDQLLHAAVPGMTLGLMLHGAEKILEELREAASGVLEVSRVKKLIDQLYRAMRPVTNLLKNPGKAKTSAFKIIEEAIFSAELRLKRHNVTLVVGKERGDSDFAIEGSKQMLVASVTNLIDNAIHWLEIRSPRQKRLYLGTSKDTSGGPSIVVADNGPGFGDDSPEDLIEPFFSRRVGGMGLGLYIVNEIMKVHSGSLLFPADGDIDIPQNLTGAVVALQFRSSK